MPPRKYTGQAPFGTYLDPASAPTDVELPNRHFSPERAFPIDLPVNRAPVVIPAGGSLTLTWPIIAPGSIGIVKRMGLSSTDFANTRTTTLVNNFSVPPIQQIIGVIGDVTNPPDLATPIILHGNDTFSVLVENIGGAPISVIVRTLGWVYTE